MAGPYRGYPSRRQFLNVQARKLGFRNYHARSRFHQTRQARTLENIVKRFAPGSSHARAVQIADRARRERFPDAYAKDAAVYMYHHGGRINLDDFSRRFRAIRPFLNKDFQQQFAHGGIEPPSGHFPSQELGFERGALHDEVVAGHVDIETLDDDFGWDPGDAWEWFDYLEYLGIEPEDYEGWYH